MKRILLFGLLLLIGLSIANQQQPSTVMEVGESVSAVEHVAVEGQEHQQVQEMEQEQVQASQEATETARQGIRTGGGKQSYPNGIRTP